MFRSIESRSLASILTVPALALLLAGGASVSGTSRSALAMCPGDVMDVQFTPEDGSAATGSDALPATSLDINSSAGLDISFTPADPEIKTAIIQAKAPANWAGDGSGGTDLGFNPMAAY